MLNFQFRELITRFLLYPDKIGITRPNSRKARKKDTIFGEGSNVKALDQVCLGTPVTWTSVPCCVLKLSDTVCNNLSLIWCLKYDQPTSRLLHVPNSFLRFKMIYSVKMAAH